MPSPNPADIQQACQLHLAGRLDEAERIYSRILHDFPEEPTCLHMFGTLLAQRGDYKAAEPVLRRSLDLVPDRPQWHSNFATFCENTSRPDEAIAHLRRALALDPAVAATHDQLACLLWQQGDASKAIEQWGRALSADVRHARSHVNLGCALITIGENEPAIAHLREALRLEPRYVGAMINLGYAMHVLERFDEAAGFYRQALALDPSNAQALSQLGLTLCKQDQIDASIEFASRATQLTPQDVGAWLNLGVCLMSLGDYTQAIEVYRRILANRPDHADARSNLLLALHYDPQIDRTAMFEEHVHFGQLHEPSLAASRFVCHNDRDPDRPLRIAYVSPDFRQHPVASFIEPVFRSFDRSKFIVSCYSDLRAGDRVTQRLRNHASHWYDVASLNEQQLAEMIHANREDILIDLAGHTARGRMLAFARKPAPVQISYLGYMDTTGLTSIDYRLTDAIVDPPGQADPFYTEKLLRLPCFFCYQPPEQASPVGPLPASSNGVITFGSLNRPVKLNPLVLELWAKLLLGVPDSRLMLGITSTGGCAKRLSELLNAYDVDPQRLVFAPRQSFRQYLDQYNSIDIALDPFPFSGHTTTCDTLWMGVPVVTLPGESYASRLTCCVLTHLGYTELIARDETQYVQIAADLARDHARLAEIRSSLRQRMRDSVITHAATFTANLEQAYRNVWQAWCAT